jgi:phosphoglycerate dehydrogenase-like enzyme
MVSRGIVLVTARCSSAGSIPDKYYSTRDLKQLEAFLRETDVLVCSLPSTKATQWMLDAEKLGWLKRDAPLFINVGRGDLIKSGEYKFEMETWRLRHRSSPTKPRVH